MVQDLYLIPQQTTGKNSRSYSSVRRKKLFRKSGTEKHRDEKVPPKIASFIVPQECALCDRASIYCNARKSKHWQSNRNPAYELEDLNSSPLNH